jgi:hypothetical protein
MSTTAVIDGVCYIQSQQPVPPERGRAFRALKIWAWLPADAVVL